MSDNTSNILVGVTQRIDRVAGRDELRDALDQKLIHWLLHAGLIPVTIPNVLSSTESPRTRDIDRWLQAVRPNALVLSGGNDIGDYPERDATERHLLCWAKENCVPVLGICRGMQMLAVWAGGSLKAVDGHVRTRHSLRNGLSGTVNSYHNFSLANCPPGFKVLATAEDGEIEAIRHQLLPWEGWMWHPEREDTYELSDIMRLKELFKV